MNTPDRNPDGYQDGSILQLASRLPKEPGRLLLLHGMIDENVHFMHTSCLVGQLIKAGVPYQLQIYPGSRHGLRSQSERDHLDATVMTFIQNALA